ncbi:MAG: bifunctional DNA primase/polymerase [Planctomycetaceae bacterium]
MDYTQDDLEQKSKYEAAVEYAEHSMRVFPCNDGKKPLIKSWPTLATTDPDQIREWWAKWPSANVGIATGQASNLLVLDIDIKGGSNGFAELEAFVGCPVEDMEAPRYSTPSGGQQLWFAYPAGDDSGICTKAHIGGLSIDTRANGGYACVPPSHTANGSYDWIVEPEEFDSLPSCPADLLDLLREPGRQKTASASGPSISAVADAEGHTLENHPGTGEGLRNGLLVVLVGKWLTCHPGAEWETLEPLVVAWNERCQPPKSEALALKPAYHIWCKEQNAPKLKLDNLCTPKAPSTDGPATLKVAAKPSGVLQLVTRQASTIEPEAVEWLWADHLQLGAVNIIAGPEGKGKSLLSSDVAARVSTGRSWPDGTPCPQGRVLYCSAEEDAASTVVPRLIAAGANLELIDVVYGLGNPDESPDDALAIDLQQHLPYVYTKLKESGDYKLCVWDTFQSVSLQTEHKSNTGQKAVAQPMAQISRELNLAMLCVEHHARSGFQRGNPDNAILGAGLVRTARAIWHVVEDPDDDRMRLFLPGKLNNADRDRQDLSWRFAFCEIMVPMNGVTVPVPAIDWIEASGTTLNEVRDAAIGDSKGPGRPNDEFERAVHWIKNALTEPTLAAVMKEGLKLENISKGTEDRARQHLMIQSIKPKAGSEADISNQTGIPIDDLPEFDGTKWWWFPPPKLVIEVPTGKSA